MNDTVAINKEGSGNCVKESKAKFFDADVNLQ